MTNSLQYRSHSDAIARLAAPIWQWLKARGVAPEDTNGTPPEVALGAYSATDDDRANEVVSVFHEVVADFGNSESELNAKIPSLAFETMQAVDTLELVFAVTIQRFIQAGRTSEEARRICVRAGIPIDQLETARRDVVLAIYTLRRTLSTFFGLWTSLAPDVMRDGVTTRSKDPVLSYFEWKMSTELGWTPEEIAEVDGTYWDVRADNERELVTERKEAVKALVKRIERMTAFFAQH